MSHAQRLRAPERRGAWYGAALFILGCLAGAFSLFIADHLACKRILAFDMAQLLDIDLVYLEKGIPMRGRVIAENEREVVFEMAPGSSIVFSRGEINRIDHNYYARYFKNAW